ncbi:ATP-binding cassette domain-containing protein [Oceanobacillus caeni]|uniref:ABC transporter ATP-binding protein n=1 Tax=Bacillaceae TaxID=186817 RepID=UPI000AE4AFDE|nr:MULTISPECIES: ATP-binding cassette domain-containing protein [Bacillaceae]MCR1832907.1 ATP-binding cassette domain-containing protein [Oceanobacillus caeni]MED4474057.1 ATP-binding cassette domain-containing protein [Oceanobacillus caeni]
MTIPIIEVENVYKYYKQARKSFSDKNKYVKAVNGVSFSLYEGESFGLVGESGSGKSTLGQVILQLIKQTSGTVKYRGKNVSTYTKKELKAWRKQVQIVFQNPYASLNPKKTIGWIMEEPLNIHRIGNKAFRRQRVMEVLEEVGLDHTFMDRYPHELSGGQRQRIAIASAIILEPEFMVIDEGVSALDASVQAQILNLLKRLQRKYRLTYLFISHDLNVVQYFCDRVAVMYLGEIVEIGETEELGRSPRHPYTKALFSSILSLDESEELKLLDGDLPSLLEI